LGLLGFAALSTNLPEHSGAGVWCAGWADPGLVPGEAQQSSRRWRVEALCLLGCASRSANLQEHSGFGCV